MFYPVKWLDYLRFKLRIRCCGGSWDAGEVQAMEG